MLFEIIFYVLGYVKKCEFKIFGNLNNLENELELKTGNVNCDFDICFEDLCNGFNYPPPTTAPANNSTPGSRQPIVLFIGVLLGILFGYVNKINNEINENEGDLELGNMNVDCYFDFYDYAPKHPPPQKIGILAHFLDFVLYFG